MQGKCLCGSVMVTIARRPDYINDCNCDFCRKSGAGWGYFVTDEVEIVGKTWSMMRPDNPDPAAILHFCSWCGSTTHYVLTPSFKRENPGVDQVGVNMRLFDPHSLEGVELMFPEGKIWDGVWPYEYRRPSMTITKCCPW